VKGFEPTMGDHSRSRSPRGRSSSSSSVTQRRASGRRSSVARERTARVA
jgi:hypothetical protein